MTQIHLDKLIYYSGFSGLENYDKTTITYSYPGGSVSSNTILTLSGAIDNAQSVSQTEIQFAGLDNNWYLFKGSLQNNYTSSNVWINTVDNKQVSVYSSYTDTSIVLKIWLSNVGFDASVTFPPMTITCNASLFIAPFQS